MRTLETSLFALFMSLVFSVNAQQVHWACKVEKVSSEFIITDAEQKSLRQDEYAANGVLGEPNVYPACGISPGAWTSRRKSDREFIEVSFCNDVAIRQIILVETLNPGNLLQVLDVSDTKEFELISLSPTQVPGDKSRIQSFFIDEGNRRINRLRFIFDVRNGNPIGIDAIGITESQNPYTVSPLLAHGLNSDVKANRLSEHVNSQKREFNPVITPDGGRIFFSRAFDSRNEGGVRDGEDIWVSRRDESTGNWLDATRVDSAINTRGPNFIASVHERHDTLIFLLGNQYRGNKVIAGLSSTTYHEGKWSKPVAIDIPDFYNYSDRGNFYMSEDDSVIVLSVSRRDSKGGQDIYASFKSESAWSAPLHIGDVINTTGDELTPVLADNNRTLFFSSNGQKGFGGLDVFVSHRLDNTWLKWSAPENLGNTVNSVDDEFGFTPGNRKIFFIRGDEENTDIWEIEGLFGKEKVDSVAVDIIAVTSKGKTLPFCEVYIDQQTFKMDSAGLLELKLPAGTKASIAGRYNGYELYAVDTVSSDKENIMLALRFKSSEPSEIKERHDLPSFRNDPKIYFDVNKADITAEFLPLLRTLAIDLIKSERKILIKGYADVTGSTDSNLLLSQKRADNVRRTLISLGVEEKQIRAIGKGESSNGLLKECRIVSFELENE